ncbi:hypothetical protein ACWN83_07145 [Pseudolactococcus plantarum]|uniref:Uncharacterized protein n=1 Tax=Pseudolactococcus plantarum TaxID=1365 RepID=A0A2A5S3J8_9LACT|nr:hypothetical protein [Lactococcus plantarum]PCS08059.1 hypothetical protein RU87_GL000796 [Lactococcus plantarum]HCN74484.1 hypothetical protein [Lactococcus sp.]
MGLIDDLKDLQLFGKALMRDGKELKTKLDRVQVEASYAELITEDIKKDIKAYQFEAQPRIDVIHQLADKIKHELKQS